MLKGLTLLYLNVYEGRVEDLPKFRECEISNQAEGTNVHSQGKELEYCNRKSSHCLKRITFENRSKVKSLAA